MPQDDTASAGGRQSAAVVNAQATADTDENEVEIEPQQHIDSADEDEEEEREDVEGEEEEEEDEEYETEEERRLGQALLRDLGALEEDEDEDEDEDDNDHDAPWGHGDDEEEEDDEEYDEMDPYLDAGGAGIFYIPGGANYDIMVGMPHEHAARAAGSVPQVNPATDTQIAPGVYARQETDSRHCLFGTPLRFVPKLLDRVFHMKQQSRQLLWKSSLELSDHEWSYIKEVLSHERVRPLLQRGERVLKPLPESGFPGRLRPKDSSGTPLRGPYVSRNTNKPWNRGRQFFSAFKDNDFSSFMWADGVMAMEAEAQESFNEYMDDGRWPDDGGMYGLFY